MTTRRGSITCAIVLASCLAPAGARAAARLVCAPSTLDFGERGHNERVSGEVTLTNRGDAPLSVLRIRSCCSSIDVRPGAIPKPLAPGASRKLAISMTSGRVLGTLEKWISVEHAPVGKAAGGASVTRIPLRMDVFRGYAVEPRELRFDEGVVGGRPLRASVEVTRPRAPEADISLKVVRIVTGSRGKESPHFKAEAVEASRGRAIEVTLLPTHPEGRIWATVEARLDGKPLVVPVAGHMFRWIKQVPTYFNFSRVCPGEPDSLLERSVVASTDGRAFRILEMTPSFRGKLPQGTRLELVVRGGKPGRAAKEHVIEARIAPPDEEFFRRSRSKTASFSGEVVVRTDHPHKPEIRFNFFGFFTVPQR